jgi:hypothetical protein
MATRRLPIVMALLLMPATAIAHGHRAEIAIAASPFVKGSSLTAKGASGAIPVCWFTKANDCRPPNPKDENDYSLVFVYTRFDGEREKSGQETNDIDLEFYLAGVRKTLPAMGKVVVPFAHILGGWARELETGQVTKSQEREGRWGSGAAFTATFGLEIEFLRYFRFRAQYGAALYTIGDNSRFGHGPAFALSVGPHAYGDYHTTPPMPGPTPTPPPPPTP